MAINYKPMEWVFGFYSFASDSKSELMVWYPDGEGGEEACFAIPKGWRDLVSGATYAVQAVNDDTGCRIKRELPQFLHHTASQAFRLRCEAETAAFKRVKAAKQAEAAFRKFDLGSMSLSEVKENLGRATARNRRSREAVIALVVDYLNGNT